jgi:predicted DCC family thiol-disulfide oxidoreductase YuxK
MVEAGLTAEDGQKQVWLVAPKGDVKGGAAAINGALNLVWWARPFTWLYSLPGLKQIEDVVYHWVARNRHHFPGVTPACESGFDCHEDR